MADEKVAEKAEYYTWLDLSQEERSLSDMPLTQDEYSKYCGVSRQSLIKWAQRRGTGGNNEQFDIQGAFRKDYKMLWELFTKEAKSGRINAALFKTFAQLANELVEKKEETHKFELTPTDFADIGKATIDGLRAEFDAGKGRCPVCGEYKLLRNQARLDTEPEHTEDREVATVALSTRPE